MKETILVPFVEGFVGCLQLAVNLFVAIATAIASVFSAFVNRTQLESPKGKPSA